MFVLFAILSFPLVMLGSDVELKKQADEKEKAAQRAGLRVMTCNVCYPVDIFQKAEIFERFAWSKRKDRIFKQVLDEAPDFIGFQETRNETGRSIVADMYEGFGHHGYDFTFFRNSPHESAWFNIIGFNAKKFALDKTHRWWVSETPDKYSDTWGNGWGRVALMASFYPIVISQLKGKDFPALDYTRQPIHIVNVHHGLKHEERMHANRILTEKVEEFAAPRRGLVAVTGDFNDFDEYGGAHERQVLKDAGYVDALTDLQTAEGVKVSGTSIMYSYDTFQPPKGKFGTQLDHIYVKSLSKGLSYKTKSHVNVKKYNGKEEQERRATCEAELLLNPDGSEMRDEFCSDHAAGIVDIELS